MRKSLHSLKNNKPSRDGPFHARQFREVPREARRMFRRLVQALNTAVAEGLWIDNRIRVHGGGFFVDAGGLAMHNE